MFTASGLLVRFLKVFEKSGYQSVKWVRYLSKANGSYQIRVRRLLYRRCRCMLTDSFNAYHAFDVKLSNAMTHSGSAMPSDPAPCKPDGCVDCDACIQV
jgi:hypothetical protein